MNAMRTLSLFVLSLAALGVLIVSPIAIAHVSGLDQWVNVPFQAVTRAMDTFR